MLNGMCVCVCMCNSQLAEGYKVFMLSHPYAQWDVCVCVCVIVNWRKDIKSLC